jgi:hypothetical protein
MTVGAAPLLEHSRARGGLARSHRDVWFPDTPPRQTSGLRRSPNDHLTVQG